jgi:hypothetical protein
LCQWRERRRILAGATAAEKQAGLQDPPAPGA